MALEITICATFSGYGVDGKPGGGVVTGGAVVPVPVYAVDVTPTGVEVDALLTTATKHIHRRIAAYYKIIGCSHVSCCADL